MNKSIIYAILIGFLLDLIAGDPHWLYHPVRLIGALITVLEKALRGVFPKTASGERMAGRVFAVLVPLITGLVVFTIEQIAGHFGSMPRLIVDALLCYWLFAVRSLKDESMKVYRALQTGDIEKSRYAVSMIVGRDTAVLDEIGVTKAAVETVAENTSDGILAPMIYMLIGGPLLGWIYKAVNTMDSMVGYKNDKYLNFGRCAAKLDDVVNYIPARLSGLLMIVSCPFAGLDMKEAWRIFRRDRYNHASPNSAQTEAVMAGALHVQLAGDAWYFGKLYKKKTIGDPIRPVEIEDIPRANRLLYAVSVLSLVIGLAIRAAVLWL